MQYYCVKIPGYIKTQQETNNMNQTTQQATTEYRHHIDALNRIIGMNYSIAMNSPESDRYSDSDVISYVVRGI